MAQKNADDDDDYEEVPPEEKGIDEGYECKLDKEQRNRPEFQALIREGEQSMFETHIPNYALRAKNYRKYLAQTAKVNN